ncbi:MAG TPA: hypothetical protein VF271_00650 [Rhodanobacteraceae bacterium]
MPHYYGATGASEDGLHRWRPYSRHPLVLGQGRGWRLARLMLHEIRWRKGPRQWWLHVAAIVLVVVLHVFLLAVSLLSRPPAPTAGSPDTVEVRFIKAPEPPPPPPPPIKMPSIKRAPTPAMPALKRAPVAAMPAVPKVAAVAPEVALQKVPAKVAVAPPKPVVPAPTMAVSPSAPTLPKVVTATPPKVVEELSSQALPAPPQQVDLTSITLPSATAPEPVPAQHVAPRVSLGKPSLKVAAQPAPALQPSLPQPVQASEPALPTVTTAVKVAAPSLQTPSLNAPSVKATLQEPQAPQQVAAAPAPRIAPVATAPRLDLPVADVSVPQAPQITTATVPVQAPEVVVTSTNPPRSVAKTTAAATPRSPATAASTWAPPDDTFKPLAGTRSSSSAPSAASSHEGTVQLMPRGNSDVMTRDTDHLGYKPTIFEQYWAPQNESILDTFLRRLIDKLTVEHTFELAPGIRAHCVLGPMVVFFACGGDPPRPPPGNSNDPRLNMAPARPLVPGLGAPATSATAGKPVLKLNIDTQCTIARVAGSPPPPGCPGAPPPPSKSDVWH